MQPMITGRSDSGRNPSKSRSIEMTKSSELARDTDSDLNVLSITREASLLVSPRVMNATSGEKLAFEKPVENSLTM